MLQAIVVPAGESLKSKVIETWRFILSVALTLLGFNLDFFSGDFTESVSPLTVRDLFLSDLTGLFWTGPGAGAGTGLGSSTLKMFVLTAELPLERSCRSNPPGNFRPNILTIDFIFSTALVERKVLPL